MSFELFQFGLIGEGGPLSFIISILFLVVFFLFYPRLMLTQIMWKLEKSVADMEALSVEAKKIVIGEISRKPDKRVKDSVGRFFEFFAIQPVALDPFGAVKRIEHIIQGQRHKFKYFVKQVAPHMGEEQQANLQMGLAGGMTVHEIAKVVRHYVEIVKKTKSFQIAMILQMQLPLIERMARSVFKGTRAMVKGRPIGDCLGPYIVAKIIGKDKVREVEEDMMLARKTIKGRDVFLLKAKGPGGRLGRPGVAVSRLLKQHKFAKVISIDAAAKLEGEKTGSVAEGVGVAMGGIGVERSYIEDISVKNEVPLDSIIVKMSGEEAIEPLRKSIINSYRDVMGAVERSLDDTKKGSKVMIVGVGNTSGVGNSEKYTKSAEEWAEKYERQLRAKKKKK